MSNVDTLQTDDIKINPSDIAQMTEDEIGEALRRIREQAKRVKTREELNQLQELRAELNNRLDQFLNIHMKALDKHPEVSKIIEDLTRLTLGVKAAVKEMRTFKSAIEKGTKILGYVDRFLQLLGKLSGVFF
jgi:cell fate (sporulation/competence/biofilm development) regulator YlbF (YheA/YmcA/DUF963 family)